MTAVVMEYDWHIHTVFSTCAYRNMEFSAIVSVALEAGLKGVGFSDHPFRAGLAEHHAKLEGVYLEFKALGGRFSLGSDAHQLDKVGRLGDPTMDFVENIGLQKKDMYRVHY